KRFQIAEAAEEAVRFVQSECRGAAGAKGPWKGSSHQDQFYFDVMDHAFITFGARVLLPHYPILRSADIGSERRLARATDDRRDPFTEKERRQMIEFLALHKESEGHARLRADLPRVIATGIASAGQKREFLVRSLGSMLGAGMHEAYVA